MKCLIVSTVLLLSTGSVVRGEDYMEHYEYCIKVGMDVVLRERVEIKVDEYVDAVVDRCHQTIVKVMEYNDNKDSAEEIRSIESAVRYMLNVAFIEYVINEVNEGE